MRRIFKKNSAVLLLCTMIISAFLPCGFSADAVTPSRDEYTLLLDGPRFYIHNEKSLGAQKGTEYYMTYTVKKAVKVPTQQGVIGTDDYTRNFPFTEGGLMRYGGSGQNLLEEGYTYFYKFVVASGGFTYNISRAKGDTIEDIVLEKIADKGTAPMKYFGVWFAYDYVEAELGDVRFYDADGNDLGVKLEYPAGSGIVLDGSGVPGPAKDVNHRYEVKVNEKRNVAVSNLRVPQTRRFYMEYTVESAQYTLNQDGFAFSNDPDSDYPHRYGFLKYTDYKALTNSVDLLEPGASYYIMFDRGEKHCNVLVTKTKDGSTERFMLNGQFGKYDESFNFASLWFGAGGDTEVSFVLKDLKIYDGKHNNLGVQTNVASDITHHGEMEDYSSCAGVYYCAETDSMITLRADQTMDHSLGGEVYGAKYLISDNVMTVTYEKTSEEYHFLYRMITDQDGNVYRRLYIYHIDFVSGDNAEVLRMEYPGENGYYSVEPQAPVRDGDTFTGWYTSSGEKYVFGKVVTQSDILYAGWEDGGIAYTPIDNEVPEQPAEDTASSGSPLVYAGGGLMLLVGLAAGALFIRRGAKG